ncbi:hypothetical protein PFISCL1PPCAC_3847, partial [Pristionchus fissidentatus]
APWGHNTEHVTGGGGGIRNISIESIVHGASEGLDAVRRPDQHPPQPPLSILLEYLLRVLILDDGDEEVRVHLNLSLHALLTGHRRLRHLHRVANLLPVVHSRSLSECVQQIGVLKQFVVERENILDAGLARNRHRIEGDDAVDVVEVVSRRLRLVGFSAVEEVPLPLLLLL